MGQDAREFLTKLYAILREAIADSGGIILPVAV